MQPNTVSGKSTRVQELTTNADEIALCFVERQRDADFQTKSQERKTGQWAQNLDSVDGFELDPFSSGNPRKFYKTYNSPL